MANQAAVMATFSTEGKWKRPIDIVIDDGMEAVDEMTMAMGNILGDSGDRLRLLYIDSCMFFGS